jgi:hypothetical protein
MIKVFIHKKYRSVPTTWNELTGKQLVQVIEVFDMDEELMPARLKLLKILSGLSWWQWVFADADELNDSLHLVDFLIKENALTKNVLPIYKGFAGPSDNFENLLMEEYVYSEAFFEKYAAEPSNVEALDDLIAILYRPRKKGYDTALNSKGDVRLPFNEFECRHYAQQEVAFWPLKVKRSILHWYEGCRGQLAADYPDVFSGSGEGDPAKYGMVSVMRNVAEKGIHGNFKDVEKLPVRMVMLELDEMMTEAKNIEKAYKK